MSEKLRNYGTQGPHVSFIDRLPWNRDRLQPAAEAVHGLEEEFAKHTDELKGRDDLTEYTADGHELRIRWAVEGFWLTRTKDLNRSLRAGEIVRLSKDGKITSVEGLLDGWMGYKSTPFSSKEDVVTVLTLMRTDLNEVMVERQARVATS